MIPNLISFSRIVLTIPIIFFILSGNVYVAAIIFIFAGFTDFLDGFLARKLDKGSLLGENLDLLADKIFVCTLLIFISFHYDNLIFMFMTILIVSREISMSTIRQYYSSLGKTDKIKVNFFGKFKTFFQISSIGLAIIFLDTDYKVLVETLIIFATIFSWASLIYYFYE
tara:strand:+ start:46 stop:552 length:507 start_codon:yes stop_codon:yes gene_type:complete